MFFFRKNRSRANRKSTTTATNEPVQVLEDRRMLAGNVLVSVDASQNLKITGDALANSVEITVQNNNVLVRGLQNTTINGGAADFTAVTGSNVLDGSLTALMGNGNDTVLFSRNLLVNGAVTVVGGNGADSLGATRGQFQSSAYFDGGAGNDRISFQNTDVGGSLRILTGTGDDVVSLETMTIGGSMVIRTNRGDDAVSLNNVTTETGQHVLIWTGLGNDDVAVRNSTIGSVLKVVTKQGADTVMMDDNTFESRVGINTGRDNDTVLARATNTFNRSLHVLAGDGNSDAVEIDPANVFNSGRKVRKNEGNTANTTTVSTRIDNATTGVIGKATAANSFFTGLVVVTPQTLTFDNTGNTTTPSTGDTLITRNSSFIVAGTTTPLATVTLDTDGDGSFDDGTVEADSTGHFSTTVTLTRRDLDTGDSVTNDQRNGLNVIAVRSTDEANAVQNKTINVDLVVNTVVQFTSNLGTYEVEMFDNVTPRMVANFMTYFSKYENSIIHRSVANFIIQGGGFTVEDGVIDDVVKGPNENNEFSTTTSNIRGTLSMAQVDGNINSGNSEWFINLTDNGPAPNNLDGVPHTVFGRVIGKGMTVVDAIAALSRTSLVDATGVSALQNVPLRNTFTALGKQLTGTVSTSTGSTLITGVGTHFTTELTSVLGNPGGARSRISINGQVFNVQSITSDTQLVVSAAATSNVSNATARTDAINDADFVRFTSITEILDQV